MGYPAKFKPEDFIYLDETIKEMQALREGGTVTLEVGEISQTDKVKYDLYTWLYHTGLKPLFKIQTIGKILLISKTAGKPMVTLRKNSDGLNDEVIGEMIRARNAEEAYLIAHTAEKEGRILSGMVGEYFEKWREIMKAYPKEVTGTPSTLPSLPPEDDEGPQGEL